MKDKEQKIMRVRKFGDPFFRDVALRDMVFLWIDPPGKHLPVKHYALLEYYCDEPGCDCRRVLLDAVSGDIPERVFASIHFGWENLAFYMKRAITSTLGDARLLKKGELEPAALNCDWADVLLAHVRKEVLADPKAVARFKRHYEMCKREQRRRAKREGEKGESRLRQKKRDD